MKIHASRLLTPNGFDENRIVTIENGMIQAIEPGTDAPVHADILTSGLFDVHCHGGNGFCARDFDLDIIEPFLNQMLSCGVTDFLMTISTGSRDVMRHGLEVTRKAMEMQKNGTLGGSRIQGVHLEGPFLSKARLGAMEEASVIAPTVEAYEEMFAGYEDIIRLISLAPEEGADELIAHLLAKGVKVQAGHTYATHDQAMHGFDQGIDSLCHSFNACRDIRHREPGVVTAAMLRDDIYMEAICDLVHLHPATIQLIYRMKGPQKMIVISDSVATHGMPDGEYFMEGYHIVVKDGVSRTIDGALDGGGVYLDGSVRNLQSIGISAENAVVMASDTPAKRMGIPHLGRIEAGMQAHLTAWDADWQVAFTVLEDGIHA